MKHLNKIIITGGSSGIGLELVKNFFGDQKNLVIFDIGACNFEESVIFKNKFPSSTVYAFEPDINNIQKYAHFAEENGIIVTPVALSNETGETIFYPSETLNGESWRMSGSILRPIVVENTSEGLYNPGLIYNMEGYKVQTMRLDFFCEQKSISNIDFIHIDVQGAEMKVLSCLGNFKPRLIYAETTAFHIYETNITSEIFINFMYGLGYDVLYQLEYDTVFYLK
jgi:FkbM family methyltransferase